MSAEWLKPVVAVLGYIAFYLTMFAGVLLIPIGLPGEFLVVAAVLVFILTAGSAVLPWWVFPVVLFLGILAEVLEFAAGFLGPVKAKGSFRSAVGAVLGGLAGAVLGSAVAPVIGTLAGAFAGTFAGAFGVEYLRTRHGPDSRRVATGAVLGRIAGSVIKVIIAILMIALVTTVLILRRNSGM